MPLNQTDSKLPKPQTFNLCCLAEPRVAVPQVRGGHAYRSGGTLFHRSQWHPPNGSRHQDRQLLHHLPWRGDAQGRQARVVLWQQVSNGT